MNIISKHTFRSSFLNLYVKMWQLQRSRVLYWLIIASEVRDENRNIAPIRFYHMWRRAFLEYCEFRE
jgi:hypothetical protein